MQLPLQPGSGSRELGVSDDEMSLGRTSGDLETPGKKKKKDLEILLGAVCQRAVPAAGCNLHPALAGRAGVKNKSCSASS